MKQSDCTNHRTQTNWPRASDLERLNKPRASRPSRRNWQAGAINCCKRGGSVFLNVFKPVQALLLSSLRFLGPRSSRGEYAELPSNITDSWPQTRQFHERGQAQYRAQAQIICVREQSTPMLRPRHQARQQTVRIRELTTASTFRKHAFAGMQVIQRQSVPSNCPYHSMAGAV